MFKKLIEMKQILSIKPKMKPAADLPTNNRNSFRDELDTQYCPTRFRESHYNSPRLLDTTKSLCSGESEQSPLQRIDMRLTNNITTAHKQRPDILHSVIAEAPALYIPHKIHTPVLCLFPKRARKSVPAKE
jgi:hypothetical protein